MSFWERAQLLCLLGMILSSCGPTYTDPFRPQSVSKTMCGVMVKNHDDRPMPTTEALSKLEGSAIGWGLLDCDKARWWGLEVRSTKAWEDPPGRGVSGETHWGEIFIEIGQPTNGKSWCQTAYVHELYHATKEWPNKYEEAVNHTGWKDPDPDWGGKSIVERIAAANSAACD